MRSGHFHGWQVTDASATAQSMKQPARVILRLDGESHVRQQTCDHCGAEYNLVTTYLLSGGTAFAVAKTALHHHDGAEAWIDVVFGSWQDDCHKTI